MNNYVFGSKEREMLRLKLQAELFKDESIRTLRLAGIKDDMRCIDLGCGNGYTTLLLAKLARNGFVVGLDVSNEVIEEAKRNARNNNINNVEFITGNVYNIERDAEFDLSYSRFLFTHLTQPEKALDEMIRVTKPNGIIVIEDFMHDLRITYPYNDYLERLRMKFIELLKRAGSKPDIAGMLYSMLRKRGIDANIQLYGICVRMDTKYKVMPLLFAEVLKDKFLQYNIMREEEYDEIYKGINEFINNNDNLALYSAVFRIYGKLSRK